MSNHRSKTSFLRRTAAGLAAAATIAVGGLSSVSAVDAQAAGVRQTVLVAPAAVVATPAVEVPAAEAPAASPKRASE